MAKANYHTEQIILWMFELIFTFSLEHKYSWWMYTRIIPNFFFFTFFQTWKETFCAIILLFHFTRNIWGNDFLIYVIIHQVLWKWQKKSIVLYFQKNHFFLQHNWQNSGNGDTMADILSPFISKYKYIQPCKKVLLSFQHLILDNNTCTLSSQ